MGRLLLFVAIAAVAWYLFRRLANPPAAGGSQPQPPQAPVTRCAECGACWNVCAADAVDFGEPRGGTGVRFLYG